MLKYLTIGVLLGTTAGISPGPMLTLVISQSLRFGIREGIKIAFAPLLSDLPIVVISWIILSRVTGFDQLLGLISLAGGVFLIMLAVEGWRAEIDTTVTSLAAPRSLTRGLLANILNPHPWLFWLTVGAPTLISAGSPLNSTAYVTGFYLCLIGSKLIIATIVGYYRLRLNPQHHRFLLRALSSVLLLLAAQMILKGCGQICS